MGNRACLPRLALITVLVLFYQMLPAGAPREAAEAKTEISSAARSIVIQMDNLPLTQLWDSVARL